MKKWLAMALLALFLTGCAQQKPQESTPTPETTQAPTEPTGFYDPDSTVEDRTRGAVRAYPLEGRQDFRLLDGNPVLISESGELTLLSGDKAIAENTVRLGRDPEVTVSGDRLGCYLGSTREVVVFDSHLQELNRVTMPQDMMGSPVISLKRNRVYYCVPDEIRYLNLDTGLTALLRSHDSRSQALMGSVFDGDVLVCQLVSSQDRMGVLYLDGETGQTIGTETGISALYNRDDRYFVLRMDGMVRQQIFGVRGREPGAMALDISGTALLPALGMNGMVTDDGQTLTLYSLESGKVTAAVDRQDLGEILHCDTDAQAFWFLCRTDAGDTLYRWDPAGTPVNGEESVLVPLYTPEHPDQAGLQQLQTRIQKMNKDYGVKIRIWQEAVQVDGGYSMVPEHQVEAISRVLDTVDEVFSQFPDWFLITSIRAGRICVDVVRSVDAPCPGLQFWDGRLGHIVLPTTGHVEQELLLGLGSIIDSHVLGNSRELDKWNEELNPEGFRYDGSYPLNARREDLSLTEGEDPAFLNAISMAFPTEDRRQIFCAAMGRENVFTTPILQQKLYVLCSGIREAYDLDKRTEDFPWEQYLEHSMAYQK